MWKRRMDMVRLKRSAISFFLVIAILAGLSAGIFAAAADLAISDVSLNETRTVITLKFNQSVSAINIDNIKNRIKLKQNDSTKSLPSGSSVGINGNTMTISLTSSLNTASNYVIIEVGALNEQTENISSPTFNAEGPKLASDGVSINDKKTQVTLQFTESISGHPNDTALKNGYIKLARNGSTFSETIASEDIEINGSSGKIIINLDSPLSGSSAKFKIIVGKLKNVSTGNINLEDIITPQISAAFDSYPPEIDYSNTNLSSDNKTLTIYFNEKIVNMYASGVSSTAAIEILKSHIHLNRNGEGYQALGGLDTVSISNNYITVKFNEPLTGSNNVVKIDAGSIGDTAGNVQYNDIETGRLIAASGSGAPVYNPSTGSYLSNGNKTITFQFSGSVKANPSLTSSQVKANVQIKRNGGSYKALSSSDTVEFSGNRVIVTLKTAFTGDNNRIKILRNTVSSLSGVLLSSDIESVYFNLDSGSYDSGDAPAYYSVSYNKDARQVRIYFNSDLRLANSNIDLEDYIKISRNGSSYSSLASKDRAYIYPSNAITIELNTALSGSSNKFRIDGGALEDNYGNLQTRVQYTDYIKVSGSGSSGDRVEFDLSSDGKTATLTFPYTIYSNFRYDSDLSQLKDEIYISRNSGRTYQKLDERDTIRLSGKTLRITLKEAMDDSDIIRINERALMDAYDEPLDFEIKVGPNYNSSGEYEPEAELDDDGYTIIIRFDDKIYNNMSSTESLKSMIRISRNGRTYYDLERSDSISVKSSYGELYIYLDDPIEDDDDVKIKILAGALEIDDMENDYDIIVSLGDDGDSGSESVSAYVNNSPVYFVNSSKTRDDDDNAEYVSVINTTSALSTLKSKSSGVNLTVNLPTSAAKGILTMSGDVLSLLKDKEGTLELRSCGALYSIPTDNIDIEEALEALGIDSKKPELATVEIEIRKIEGQYLNDLKRNAQTYDYSVVTEPVEISLSLKYLSNSFVISDSDMFDKKGFILNKSQYSNANVTIVRIEDSGKVNHVPSKSESKSGEYILSASTLKNGVYAVVSASHYFSDTPNWAAPAVNTLASRLVIHGKTGTAFNPKDSVTRAEMAGVITRALGLNTDVEGASMFFDITLTDEYFTAVTSAAKYKLILGYEDSTFRPENKITRQEAMSIIARAARLAKGVEVSELSGMSKEQAKSILSRFKDANKVADWALVNMAECVQNGVVNGDDLGNLNPTAQVTRAELAQLAYNILKKFDFI